MGKHLFLSVSCVNDLATDFQESFYIYITEEIANCIRRIAKSVVDMQVFAVEQFNYEGDWSLLSLDDHNSVLDTFDDAYCLRDKLKVDSLSVDIPMLRVTANYFSFKCIPKHGSASVALTTSRVKITDLDNDLPLLKL